MEEHLVSSISLRIALDVSVLFLSPKYLFSYHFIALDLSLFKHLVLLLHVVCVEHTHCSGPKIILRILQNCKYLYLNVVCLMSDKLFSYTKDKLQIWSNIFHFFLFRERFKSPERSKPDSDDGKGHSWLIQTSCSSSNICLTLPDLFSRNTCYSWPGWSTGRWTCFTGGKSTKVFFIFIFFQIY